MQPLCCKKTYHGGRWLPKAWFVETHQVITSYSGSYNPSIDIHSVACCKCVSQYRRKFNILFCLFVFLLLYYLFLCLFSDPVVFIIPRTRHLSNSSGSQPRVYTGLHTKDSIIQKALGLWNLTTCGLRISLRPTNGCTRTSWACLLCVPVQWKQMRMLGQLKLLVLVKNMQIGQMLVF